MNDPEVELEVTPAEPGGAGEPRPRWYRRIDLSWARLRRVSPWLALGGWAVVVLVVALARVSPWDRWRSWRRWLRDDRRGWELAIPGLLLAAAVYAVTRAHDRWRAEGWSPEVAGLMVAGVLAGAGGVFWGLFCLDLRPFAG